MDKNFEISLKVKDSNGMRLDRWLRNQYPALTQGLIEKLLRLGKIRLGDQKTTSNTRISIGQSITIPENIISPSFLAPRFPEKQACSLTADDEALIKSLIIWEDDDILVLNKTFGLATQGGSKLTRHLDGLLVSYGQKTHVRYRLVHRLDRDTTGVLVIAKTADVATFLTKQFHLKTVKKIYWAIVMGQPVPAKETIDAPLLKGGDYSDEKVYVNKNGKPALTYYRTVTGLKGRKTTDFSWLELIPETGRTHQLRVHMSHIGHPVLGDGKYGGPEATAASRKLHLHARSLTLPDHSTGFPLTFVAPPPLHITDTLENYKIDWERKA